MKRRFAILLALAMLFTMTAVPVWAEEAAPTVILDGKNLSFDVPPMIEDGRTLVPLRAIFEAMGATVSWDDNTKTATAVKGNTEVILKIGSLEPTINGTVQKLDVPGKIVNGRTLAPLRFVGEAFGGSVTWDGVKREVVITSAAAPAPEPAPAQEPEPAPAAPASAADIVKASLAAFSEIDCQMEFTGPVKATPYGDLNCVIKGTGNINASKAASSQYSADLGALDNGDRSVDACMFSEVICGPEADGLALVSQGVLSEENGNYVITLTGVDCPQSVLGILNKACSTVPIDFIIKMDCKIKFDKASGKIAAVDNIVLSGKAKTAIGSYDANFTGNIKYTFK
jgi:hypothetical protein